MGDRFVYLISAEHHSAYQLSQPYNLLETNMKRTFLSKTVSILGAIAALSAVVSVGVQQTAQAQNVSEADTEVPTAAEIEAEKVCLAAYPQDQVFEGGRAFFDEMQGITLSPEQNEELDRLSAATTERANRIQENAVRVLDPNSIVDFVPLTGSIVDMPVEIATPIYQRISFLEQETSMDAFEQTAVLTEEFGQYAKFGSGSKLIYTPEQMAELSENQQDIDDNFFSILTPEQQQKLKENQIIYSRINAACGIPENDATIARYGFDPDFSE